MKRLCTGTILAGVGLAMAAPTYAGDGVELEIGADIVSSYVWRGQDCGGFSIQPSATLSWKGLSFGVWASAELFESGDDMANMKEFDLSLAYEVGGLSIGITDYNFCTGGYFSDWRFNGASSHQMEANLGYDFGPVALSWNTLLTGPDHKANGDRAYSTYVEVSAPFTVSGVECSAAVGASLWDDMFTAVNNDKFNVVNCSVTAKKDVKGLPLFGQIVVNPQSEATYFVIGLTF